MLLRCTVGATARVAATRQLKCARKHTHTHPTRHSPFQARHSVRRGHIPLQCACGVAWGRTLRSYAARAAGPVDAQLQLQSLNLRSAHTAFSAPAGLTGHTLSTDIFSRAWRRPCVRRQSVTRHCAQTLSCTPFLRRVPRYKSARTSLTPVYAYEYNVHSTAPCL
jgi:hypothetical protein